MAIPKTEEELRELDATLSSTPEIDSRPTIYALAQLTMEKRVRRCVYAPSEATDCSARR